MTAQEKMREEKLFSELLTTLQEQPMFGTILMNENMLDMNRLSLLQEILLAIQQKELEQSRTQIFQYGSMVGRNDLFARQIFLCLLVCLEEQERLQTNI